MMKQMVRKATMKFKSFSNKQKKVLAWWADNSPVNHMDGIIADGAIRSGKTVSMALSFVMWAMYRFEGQNFAMCGKTVGSFRRNVWFWLKLILICRGYDIHEIRNENLAIITIGVKTNYFYIFGGKDEASQDLIQGITLGGVLFDEVALMPESFVNQATGRCSVENSKFWFNCNPDSPLHWFKINWIEKAKEKNLIHLHFMMDDNLSLSEEIKMRYRRQYVGVFFKRFILGLWVMAEGAIYDMFTDDLLFDQNGPDLNFWYERFYSCDYGTTNAFAVLEIIRQNGINWVVDELYYDSKKAGRQKEDIEYVDDLIKFIDGKRYTTIVLDPSAASFKVAARRKGLKIKEADNEVLDGIRLVASLFGARLLRVHKKCINLRQSIAAYVWDDKARLRGEEKPVKVEDHAADGLRYYCRTIVKVVGKFT
jgi:PBSX family phage terminase large subunit